VTCCKAEFSDPMQYISLKFMLLSVGLSMRAKRIVFIKLNVMETVFFLSHLITNTLFAQP
jgi:hypothetical protein